MKTAHRAEERAAAVPGPSSRAAYAAEQAYIAPGLQRIAQLSELTIERGSGSTLIDTDGNEFLDFFAGVAVASLGHSHPRFVKAMQAQLEKSVVGSFTTAPRLKLLELLAELAPGNLARTQLYSGGSEAVEAAIRLAKSYTKKFEIVGFWGGFHGKTGGVMGLIGDSWKQKWGPLMGGTHLVPYADCYRCPLKTSYPGCGLACVELAREHDALLIADEMITGFGRTGKMFGVEHTGVEPDVMTIGKGFGCGFPVTGLISRDEITSSLPFAKPSSSSSSYGGNPLGATAALATVETIIDEQLVENAATVGKVLLDGLRALQEKYEFIGDVRGSGLLIGMDLVTDRATKEPLPSPVTESIFLGALRRGLLLMGYFSRVRINPPLVLTESEARDGVAILDEVFGEIAAEGRYRA